MAKSNPPTNTSSLLPAVSNSNAPSNALESSSARASTIPNAPSNALGLSRQDGNITTKKEEEQEDCEKQSSNKQINPSDGCL